MRTGTVSYKLEDLKKGVIIPIGFVGENDFTKVFFDAEEIYKKYPSASVSMKVQPPKGVIYPATVTRDGNTVIWQVKEADVANRGDGELQLTFTDGETKIKTYIAKTDVKRSLAGNGPAPDPIQDFVDNANEKLAEVDDALEDLAAMDNIAKNAQASDIGKALSPKTVEDGVVTEWEYITPGGGTEDYTDLENKPSIAGVELSGNKSLADLGIAAESAIPDVSGKANLSVVAPAFDQATANDAGSLVTYTDGVVYVLPEGHTAGTTWANTQKTATNIAEQQRLLKNAIHGQTEQINKIENALKGRKCVYPSLFISRIKPNIFYNGVFYTDLNADAYKISGDNIKYIDPNGNDTNDGTSEHPYKTLTRAIDVNAKTVYAKAGTYKQGTHFATNTKLGKRNLIGIGNVIFENDGSGHYLQVNSDSYIENIIFQSPLDDSGSSSVIACVGDGYTACFVDCKFLNGKKHGFGCSGMDAILIRCETAYNKIDGFNYSARTVSGNTYITNAIEIDCKSHDNGNAQSGQNSCNCSTIHKGVRIVRVNGEYYNSYGGVIADITEQQDAQSMSVNFGVSAHDSTGVLNFNAAFWASKDMEMYLFNCVSYGCTYDMVSLEESKIVTSGLMYGGDQPNTDIDAQSSIIEK